MQSLRRDGCRFCASYGRMLEVESRRRHGYDRCAHGARRHGLCKSKSVRDPKKLTCRSMLTSRRSPRHRAQWPSGRARRSTRQQTIGASTTRSETFNGNAGLQRRSTISIATHSQGTPLKPTPGRDCQRPLDPRMFLRRLPRMNQPTLRPSRRWGPRPSEAEAIPVAFVVSPQRTSSSASAGQVGGGTAIVEARRKR